MIGPVVVGEHRKFLVWQVRHTRRFPDDGIDEGEENAGERCCRLFGRWRGGFLCVLGGYSIILFWFAGVRKSLLRGRPGSTSVVCREVL